MKNKKTKQIIELNSDQYMNSNNESLVQISSVSSFQTGLEEINSIAKISTYLVPLGRGLNDKW